MIQRRTAERHGSSRGRTHTIAITRQITAARTAAATAAVTERNKYGDDDRNRTVLRLLYRMQERTTVI